MNEVFVDTAYVIALVNEGDQYHRDAIELSTKLLDSHKVTTVPVLLEIGNALAKNFRKESIGIIERFRTSQNITLVQIGESDFIKGFEMYRSYDDKSWSLTDCISFVTMKRFNLNDVLTSDKHFEQAGFNMLMKARK